MPHLAVPFQRIGPITVPNLPADPPVEFDLPSTGGQAQLVNIYAKAAGAFGGNVLINLVPFTEDGDLEGIPMGLSIAINPVTTEWRFACVADSYAPVSSSRAGPIFTVVEPFRLIGDTYYKVRITRTAGAGPDQLYLGIAQDRAGVYGLPAAYVGSETGVAGPVPVNALSFAGGIAGYRRSGLIPFLNAAGDQDIPLAAAGGPSTFVEAAFPHDTQVQNVVLMAGCTEQRQFDLRYCDDDGVPLSTSICQRIGVGLDWAVGNPTSLWGRCLQDAPPNGFFPPYSRTPLGSMTRTRLEIIPIAGNTAVSAKLWLGWYGPFRPTP